MTDSIEATAHSRPLAHVWLSLEAERSQESPLAANFKAGSPVTISPEHGEGTEGSSLGLLPATTENAEGPGGSEECVLMPPRSLTPPLAWPQLVTCNLDSQTSASQQGAGK